MRSVELWLSALWHRTDLQVITDVSEERNVLIFSSWTENLRQELEIAGRTFLVARRLFLQKLCC
jgi:hypothetical protein